MAKRRKGKKKISVYPPEVSDKDAEKASIGIYAYDTGFCFFSIKSNVYQCIRRRQIHESCVGSTAV